MIAPELPLLQLRDGLPHVIDTASGLAQVCQRFAAGTGPVAVDAERASGYRYSQRAYLVQLRRTGAGTALIDPVAFSTDELAQLQDVIGEQEWVLHAASQDLDCLAEIGLRPARLFDTELAGRLLGLPRVGLATMVAEYLGYQLLKEHSAADWSTRPLPEPWLQYAALDVEVLIELRDLVAQDLHDAGKWQWAVEEFEHVRRAPAKTPDDDVDSWRRLSGVPRLRSTRKLAVARELWQSRDDLAQELDTAPGRLMKDAAIMEAAQAEPRSQHALASLPAFRSRARRELPRWWAAVRQAMALPDNQLPQPRPREGGPPPARTWRDKFPEPSARLSATRQILGELANELQIPVENLAPPEAIRKVCWEPPAPADTESVAMALQQAGVRPWQLELIAGPVAKALGAAPTT